MSYRIFGPDFTIPATNIPSVDGYTVGTTGSNATYICTGTNDDTTINTAITDLYAAGGGTVHLLQGTYSITNAIVLLSNVQLKGAGVGATKIVIASGFNDGGNVGAITAIGSDTTGTAITLSANLVDGYNTVSINSSSEANLVSVDDYLYLRSNALWETTEQSGRTIGEFVKILSKTSTQYVIYGMARNTYNTADTARFYRQTLVSNVGVSDLEIYQQAAEGSRSAPQPIINLTQTINATIKNCYLHNSDQAGVLVKLSINTSITDCVISELTDDTSNNQYGYAVQTLGSEDVVIQGNRFHRVRHALTTGGGSYGVARNISFTNNTASHCTNSAVDTHNQSENVLIANNSIDNCNAYGIFTRGRNTRIHSNAIDWCGNGIQIGLAPYQVSGGSGSGSVIMNNSVRNIYGNNYTTLYSVTSSGTGISLTLCDNIRVVGNVVENCESYGINIQNKVLNCLIMDNSIFNCNTANTSNISAIVISSNVNASTATLTFSNPTITLTYTGTSFANYHVGSTIVISGAATSSNNGSFTILTVGANNTLTYSNSSGATDANNGSITLAIENNTDNQFINNIAGNNPASLWDTVSSGGHMKYFVRDTGTAGAGGNVRNIFKGNTSYGMETGLFSQQNTSSFFSSNSQSEVFPIKNITNAADDGYFFTTPEVGTLAINTSSNATYIRRNSSNSWGELITSGTNIIGNTLTWSNSSTPTINQSSISTANGATLQLSAQAATGDTFNGGNIGLAAGNSSGTTGTGGSVNIQAGSGNTAGGNINLRQSSTTAIAITPNPTGATQIAVVAGATSFKIIQSTNVTNGATGSTFTIQAQNASGTTSTGGDLALTSGTGTTAAGAITIKTGGTTRLTANATGVITVANLSTGVVHADSSGNLTSSTIVNADVNASAAIDGSKITSATTGALGVVQLAGDLAGTATSPTVVSLTGSSGTINIATSGNILTWASGTTAPGVAQSTVASGTGATLTVQAQNTSSGTGGALTLTSGTGTTAAGSVNIQTGGVSRVMVNPTTTTFADTATALTITPASAGTTIIQFATGATAANINQADKTTNSGTGAALTIQAQNETGTTSTGGALNLTSGTGTTTDGSVTLKTGTTARLTIAPTLATISLPTLQFETSVSSPTLNQADNATASATAQAFTVKAANATGTGTTNGGLLSLFGGDGYNGGAVNLSAGAGSGTGVGVGGNVNIIVGSSIASPGNRVIAFCEGTTSTSAVKFQINASGSSTMSIQPAVTAFSIQHNSTSTASGASLTMTAQSSTLASSTGGALNLGSGTGTSTNGNINFRLSGSNAMVFTPSNTGANTMTWVAGATAITLNQSNVNTTSATGATFTIQAQNASGTTSTGGALTLTSGTGTTTAGNINLQTGATTQMTIAPNAITMGVATTSVNTINGSNRFTTRTVSGNITVDNTTTDTILLVNTAAARSITLPAPTNGRFIMLKDITGTAGTNNITLIRNGSEKIEGVAASKVLSTNFGGWIILSDGSDWYLI